MLRIVKINPTVGKSVVAAVVVSDKNDDHLHSVLTRYVESNYGEYASIAYTEKFVVPALKLEGYNVTEFINVDELIANGY